MTLLVHCVLRLLNFFLHLFIECNFSRAVWFGAGLLHCLDPSSEIGTWLQKVICDKGSECLTLVCHMLWSIWKTRNDLCFSGKLADPVRTFQLASYFDQEFTSSNASDKARDDHPSVRKWTAPPLGFLKLNVDANVRGDWLGFGCVIRDHEGTVMLAASSSTNLRADPTFAEALALRWALGVAKQANFSGLFVETDSLVVARGYYKVRLYPDIQLIIDDCLMVADSLVIHSVSHVYRQQNSAAHVLASLAFSCSDTVWSGNVPPHILDVILADSSLY